MLAQKKTINNVPTLVPLTADTGSGAPLGTIHGFYKKGSYPGYLYLDGSTFDETLYPALYAYLGTNVLPDYREFVLVGAEQNTTSATIAAHDVFTQGQEKDDQLQEHEHQLNLLGSISHIGQSTNDGTYGNYKSGGSDIVNEVRAKDIPVGRHGTTTRTKEKAVFWYIKATTGISESEATDVLNLMTNRMFPDYAHPISIPGGSTSWTATEGCYITYVYMTSTYTLDARLTINGNIVGTYDTGGEQGVYTTTFSGFVKKGQIISTVGGAGLAPNKIRIFPLSS